MKLKSLFVLLIFSIQSFSCKKDKPLPDIANGLVAFFPLNGVAYDSVNNAYGIIHSVTSTKNRNNINGMAMNFSRTDSSFINFNDHINYSLISKVFTINCWVNPIDSIETGAVLSKRNPGGPFEYSLDNHFSHSVFNFDNWPYDGNGSVYGIDPLKASSTLKLNEWHMITYVADGSSLKVYTDGILQTGIDNYNAGKDFNDTDAPFMIGVGGPWGVNFYFNGAIDDVKIYNRVLSEEQVKYLMQK